MVGAEGQVQVYMIAGWPRLGLNSQETSLRSNVGVLVKREGGCFRRPKSDSSRIWLWKLVWVQQRGMGHVYSVFQMVSISQGLLPEAPPQWNLPRTGRLLSKYKLCSKPSAEGDCFLFSTFYYCFTPLTRVIMIYCFMFIIIYIWVDISRSTVSFWDISCLMFIFICLSVAFSKKKIHFKSPAYEWIPIWEHIRKSICS